MLASQANNNAATQAERAVAGPSKRAASNDNATSQEERNGSGPSNKGSTTGEGGSQSNNGSSQNRNSERRENPGRPTRGRVLVPPSQVNDNATGQEERYVVGPSNGGAKREEDQKVDALFDVVQEEETGEL